MATEAQYQCFKDIYDSETARYDRLAERAKLYLSVITLYFGLLAVAADKVVPHIHESSWAIGLYLASVVALALSLVYVVFSMGIYTYVYPTNPLTVIESLGTSWPSDEEFFDKRIAELTAAFLNNHPINERRADLLRVASILLLVGIVLQGSVLTFLVFLQH